MPEESSLSALDQVTQDFGPGFEATKVLDLPTLLIFGELDKMINLDAGKKFSNLVKNSSTHVIKGCGHMIMIEKAFEMREKILEFLIK